MSYFPNISSINTNEYTLFAEEGQSGALNSWWLHVNKPKVSDWDQIYVRVFPAI